MVESSPTNRRSSFDDLAPEEAAPLLRERIYGTVTALATITTLAVGEDEARAGEAVVTLLVTIGALWLASVFADSTGHLAAHQKWPTVLEWRHMARTTGQILASLPAPLLLLTCAAFGLWRVDTALYWAAGVQVLTLGFMGGLAVRSLPLSTWVKALIVAAEVLLGLLVVAVKLLAH
jgi:hypothetical protein